MLCFVVRLVSQKKRDVVVLPADCSDKIRIASLLLVAASSDL
jgi:hypothetical protein